jgi:hypothetical protein
MSHFDSPLLHAFSPVRSYDAGHVAHDDLDDPRRREAAARLVGHARPHPTAKRAVGRARQVGLIAKHLLHRRRNVRLRVRVTWPCAASSAAILR